MYKESSHADGLLTSPALESLKSQLSKAQSDLSYWQAKSAEYQSNFDRRLSCGGFKQPCNNWLDRRNEANANISSINNNINSLNTQIQNELKTLQAQVQAKIDAEAAAAKAKAASDPTLAKIELEKAANAIQAMTKDKELQNKRYLIIGVVIAVLLIAGGVTYYFVKVRKG